MQVDALSRRGSYEQNLSSLSLTHFHIRQANPDKVILVRPRASACWNNCEAAITLQYRQQLAPVSS